MKRWKYFVVALAVLLLFAFAACADGQEDDSGASNKPTVTISTPSASLDLYDTLQLTAHAENTDEPIAWSSSDPSRASVEGGLVTALATGNVRITASAGGASAVCTVAITDSQAAPVLSVSDAAIELEAGKTFTVTASVTLKGEPVENVTYTWTGGDAVVSLRADGAGAVLEGLAAGTTEIYVSATVRGIYTAKKIDVTVRAFDIVFDLANCTPHAGGTYSAELYTLAAQGYADSLVPKLTIYQNGSVVSDPSVTWESRNEDVVRVEGGQTFVAVAEGKADVVGTFNGESIKVNVTVTRTQLRLEGSVVAEEMNLQPIRINGEMQGTVADATFKGVSVFKSFDAASGTLSLSAENYPKDAAHLGEGELVLSTEKADYSIAATLYTMITNDSAELDSMRGIGEGADGYICDGYYVLGNDITYTSNTFITLAPEGVVGRGGQSAIDGIEGGFRGVFDGKGFTISGLKFDLSYSTRAYNGMFGVLHRDGVVQNVAFEDASICGALIAYRGSGTVRNVYVKYASIAGGTEGHYTGFIYTGGAAAGATVETVFIDASDSSAYQNTLSSNTRLIGCGVGSAMVYNDVYLISPSSLRNAAITNAAGSDAYYAYRNYADFAKDAAAQNAIAKWDPTIWTTDGNGCPVFR